MTVAASDPLRACLKALRTHRPDATHVLDAFRVTKIGFAALDEVRRTSGMRQLSGLSMGFCDHCMAGESGSHVSVTRQWAEHMSAWFERYAHPRWAAAEPYWG